MTDFYIIRHGKTELNKKKIIMGSLDSPLTEEAISSTKEILAKLEDIPVEIIYTSSLRRAKATAQLINKTLGIKIIESDELREIDYGTISGMTKEEAKAKYPLYHNESSFVNPKGESFDDLFLRVTKFIKSIEEKYEKVLIVTHAGCIRALYSYCKEEEFNKNINIPVKHDAILYCKIEKSKKTATFI